MFNKNEFQKYAAKHLGMSSMHLEKYINATTPVTVPDIRAFTPAVIEERQMNAAALDVFSRLMMDRIIFMGVPVTEYVSNVIQAQLLFLESADPKRDVQMFINSPGGSVIDGLGIYDTMQYVKPSINTICLGQAASMGAFLLTAGTKGKRYALPNATIHLHQPLGGAQGQASDIEIQANEILRLKKLLNGMIMRHSTMTEDVVLKYTDRDYYMTAELAKQHGLIDEILLTSASKLNLLNQVVQPAAAQPKP